MREKKSWKKGIDQVELQQALENMSRQKEVAAQRSAIPNESLFTVAKKAGQGLKEKREKLKKDRFKRKEDLNKSKYEEVIVKKLVERKTSAPAAAVAAPKKKSQEEEEFGDLWADEEPKVSKTLAKFKKFTERTVTKVNPVVIPLAGQSYNPSGKDHKVVIEKVIEEETKDVKEIQRQLRTLKPHLFSTEAEQVKPIKEGLLKKAESSSDEEDIDEESDNEIGEERTNAKPVDRKRKLTKTERNLKLMKRLRNQA